MPIPDRSTFESAYAGQAHWDIGRPQKALIDMADKITGSILDAGCGTGDNALYFAGRGQKVTGIDFLEEPINRAKQKASERGLSATFLVRLFLVCFSDQEPGTQGPRRVSRREIEVAFAEGWAVESIEPTRFEVRPDLKDIAFSDGGPKAWFVVVRRA